MNDSLTGRCAYGLDLETQTCAVCRPRFYGEDCMDDRFDTQFALIVVSCAINWLPLFVTLAYYVYVVIRMVKMKKKYFSVVGMVMNILFLYFVSAIIVSVDPSSMIFIVEPLVFDTFNNMLSFSLLVCTLLLLLVWLQVLSRRKKVGKQLHGFRTARIISYTIVGISILVVCVGSIVGILLPDVYAFIFLIMSVINIICSLAICTLAVYVFILATKFKTVGGYLKYLTKLLKSFLAMVLVSFLYTILYITILIVALGNSSNDEFFYSVLLMGPAHRIIQCFHVWFALYFVSRDSTAYSSASSRNKSSINSKSRVVKA